MGERIRQNYKSHGEAVNCKQELEVQSANIQVAGQLVFSRLKPDEVNDAESALNVLRATGHDCLHEVALFFVREAVVTVVVTLQTTSDI